MATNLSVLNLYSAPGGGTAVCGSFTFDGGAGNGLGALADLVNGRFNVILGPLDGAGRPLAPAFLGGGDLYLGIALDANSEISPRQQILAAPETLHAQIADTVPDRAIGTAQIADGSITAAKLDGATGVWVGNAGNIYHDAGNVGIGTTSPAAKLQLESSTQQSERLRLSGQEFYKPDVTSPDGISFLLGVNRDGNRQLWIADSALLAVNTSNPTIRFLVDNPRIDAVATDGISYLPLNLGGGVTILPSGNVGVGTSTPTANLDVRGDIKLGNSGQFFAASGEENLRIARGAVNTPTSSGVGFTSARTPGFPTGDYTITFSIPFTSPPIVTANASAFGAIVCAVVVNSSTSVRIVTYNSAGGFATGSFHNDPSRTLIQFRTLHTRIAELLERCAGWKTGGTR